jgi:integrase/recombinase XerD
MKSTREGVPRKQKARGQTVSTNSATDADREQDLTSAIRETVQLWRRHHLSYDQTKYVVEKARRQMGLTAPGQRKRTVDRLDKVEVERLIGAAYRHQSKYGLMVKTLFYCGARVSEFVHIQVQELYPYSDPPQIHLTHAKRQSTRYVPILRSLAQELQTYLGDRKAGYLFESNRHTRYSVRAVQDIISEAARAAGITKRVYPHLLRHSVATLLLESGQVPLDQVQKFLGHLQIGTTQIYAQTSLQALGDNYQKAFATV